MDIENSNHAKKSDCVLALLDTTLHALASPSGLYPGMCRLQGGRGGPPYFVLCHLDNVNPLFACNHRVASIQTRDQLTISSLSHFVNNSQPTRHGVDCHNRGRHQH